MEETNNTTAKTGAGKGLIISGFVVSLVALVFWYIVNAGTLLAAAFGGGNGMSMFWLILSLLGLGLSAMGLMKANKGNGGKKGLGIAALVIGIVATLLSCLTMYWVMEVHKKVGDAGKELLNAFGEGIKEGIEKMDSATKTLDAPADTTAH